MRLLNALSRQLELFPDPIPEDVPYAILSHTWETDEVTFVDLKSPSIAESKSGFAKIVAACDKTIEFGLIYVWIDSCCIDKSSSAELSEAINSMFRWYKNATVCFTYLSDLPVGVDISEVSVFRECRWFTRGWTLQELIAPDNLVFFNEDWNPIGTKLDYRDQIEAITGISRWILDGSGSLLSVPLAKRMSWAAQRDTTRVEDKAYCLMGIFDVNMPMIYGEGSRAFIRLQEEILRKTTDLSILAWQAFDTKESARGILARSPSEFLASGHIELSDDQFCFQDEISLTNRGVKIRIPIRYVGNETYVMDLHCFSVAPPLYDAQRLCIYLKRASDTYYRVSPHMNTITQTDIVPNLPRMIFLASTTYEQSIALLSTSTESRQIRFIFPTDTPLFRVRDIRAVPETYWEAHERFFSITRLSNFTCFVRFSITSTVWPAERNYGPCKEETTPFILVCDLAARTDFRVSLYAQTGLQSSAKPERFIDPFTNIGDYGPLGDAYSLSLLRPGEIEDRRVSMMHTDHRHNYVVEAHISRVPPSCFSAIISISRPEDLTPRQRPAYYPHEPARPKTPEDRKPPDADRYNPRVREAMSVAAPRDFGY